ncbi:FTR1 family iron permease [Gallionella capsiferriformans]|jgi:high-affinity iron transporter|uniref:Iron permease FTR1 n=1 Tax=Gallionella capsiferriformans (strain ES-2) TaxID=395494 RepID=D9SEC1_GALCS|nr:FTR1 family protein [Gallionella capsiferriformans]ADL54897.1 iron permease FTR1 [Gallionella capsiferriformans ES-2]ADL56183.1 iron permease FTR1 [Gallionella capsiferriformans ES-2]
MFATAIIVFREVLEASIIIGILTAATRSIHGSKRWLAAGLVAGLVGSGLVAASTDVIGSLASGIGQEIFNTIVLGIAVLMLAWHNIWMASHGAALATNARLVGSAIRDGNSECSVLFVIVGLAVLREGSETVLFLYGIATSGEGGQSSMLLGGMVGMLLGIVVGYTIFAGLLRVPMRWFFAATGILVLLLAAGMASQAAHFLIQADLLPSLASPLWDTSALLPESGLTGILLHSLIGYDSRPAGMQIIFYLTALIVIFIGMKWAARSQPTTVRK